MKDLVLIPTYNERGNIESIISRVRSAQPQAEIRVIDDNSPDGTADIVRSIAATDRMVRLYSRAKKEGLGEAYKDALSKVQNESGVRYVITMDADGSHDPVALESLINTLEMGYDMVIGSRYITGGKVTGWSKIRLLLSWCGNMYTRIIIGSPIHDSTAGFVAFRARIIETLDFSTISGHGYAYQIEFKNALVKRGIKWKEVPITFIERKIGNSKISGRIVLEGIRMPWRIKRKNDSMRH